MTKALLSGNEAVAEGALAAGVRFFAGYPISPSSEIATVMARRLPALGGAFLQMEDEIASLAAVIGPSLTGMKAMDATSGPGSPEGREHRPGHHAGGALRHRGCQRVGPARAWPPIRPRATFMFARWGTHGDHPITPSSSTVQECSPRPSAR